MTNFDLSAVIVFGRRSYQYIVDLCVSRTAIFNWCATKYLKHAIPDYLVRDTDFFSLRFSDKKNENDNSQYSNSHSV